VSQPPSSLKSCYTAPALVAVHLSKPYTGQLTTMQLTSSALVSAL
jgi:hypothetical protein